MYRLLNPLGTTGRRG